MPKPDLHDEITSICNKLGLNRDAVFLIDIQLEPKMCSIRYYVRGDDGRIRLGDNGRAIEASIVAGVQT